MKSENGPISDFKNPGFRSHKTWPEAEQGYGAQGIEMTEVLVYLQIGVSLPGPPACHRRGPGLDRVGGAGGVRNRSATGFARRVDG